MQNFRFLLFAGLLAIASVGHSQIAPGAVAPAAPSPSTAAAVPSPAPPVPLLWKVSDQDNAVYILASFHLLKSSDYPLSPDVYAAFADAEQLLFELAPEEMASPTLGTQMGQAALRIDGTRLDQELTPALAARLKAWAKSNQAALQKAGITIDALQSFEAWFVALTISIVEMTELGLDPKLGLDMHFASAAKQAGKPAGGLETGEQQIAFLDTMNNVEQLQMLAEALDESEQGRAQIETLHRLWRQGNGDGIWREAAIEMKAMYPKLYQRINVERNDNWLQKIEQRLHQSKDDTLLIVGALHTLGNDGIVAKLAAKGYKVERICSACAIPEIIFDDLSEDGLGEDDGSENDLDESDPVDKDSDKKEPSK